MGNVRSSSRPPAELIAWVEQVLGSGARVAGWTRLTGGLTSMVHALTVERTGARERYVLRWWEPDSEWQQWILRAVPLETAVLMKLERSGIPVPRVIASTTDAVLGGPAVLMTRLPGEVQLMPDDRERWLRAMAQMLARIHALAIDEKPFASWLDRQHWSPPPDASRPGVWAQAIALVAEERAPTRTCFLHRDYQHFNLLWSRERLTGVVDWSEACVGPPEIDVGHCRLNLTVLFSADVADRFREMYEAESGYKVDAPWDVHALLSYGPSWKHFLPVQIDGRAPLDADGMTRRMEEVLERALRRIR
jgi:aminoglycoside phosphotransferase (APT) family kinase protein